MTKLKHIRKFESYRTKKHRDEIIRESVLQVNDIYKVKTMIDIPQSLINAYIKKVKDTTGKNLRQFFGDVDLAEEIVKYITLNNLDVDKIPGGALMGGQTQAQGQQQAQNDIPAQAQTQPAQVQPQQQAQAPQTQVQPQVQVQTQAEGGQNTGEFEEPVQQQAQAQTKIEGGQAQQEEGEEEKKEGEEDEEFGQEEKEEGEEELPL